MSRKPLRRDKETPSADMWHTLRVGFVVAIFIWGGVGAFSAIVH